MNNRHLEPLVVSVEDTAWLLGGISKGHVRNLLASGFLSRVSVGRRVMVTMASIKALVKRGEIPPPSQDVAKHATAPAMLVRTELPNVKPNFLDGDAHTELHALLDQGVISMRCFGVLRRARVTTLAQISKMTHRELLALAGFGSKSLNEIVDVFKSRGLRWHAMSEDGFYSITGTDADSLIQ